MQLYVKVKSDVTYYFPIPFQDDTYALAHRRSSRMSPVDVIEKTRTHIRLHYKGKPRMFLFFGK